MTRRDSLKLLSLLGLRAALPPNACRAMSPEPPPLTQTQAIADATAAFGCNLFAKVRSKPGNLFFSPLSIEVALAMTSLGARGETQTEMNGVLRIPLPRAHSGAGVFLNGLQGKPAAGFELSIANALWMQQGYSFKKEFLSQTQMYYDAVPHSVDFGQTEKARETINRWVEQNTKDKIKDLLPSGSLTAVTRLVLTNAIYFKSKWADPFDKKSTRDEPFHVTSDKTVQAPLMQRWGRYRYFAGAGVQAVELPYAGGRMSMLVVLPAAADGLSALEKTLTADRARGWVDHLRSKFGQVLLPRFKVADEFDLGDTLQDMGMKLAFSNSADFSGISAEQLLISKVIHKAFVETNEEGTEAAAATGVAMAPKAAAPEPETPFTFRADRPFLFVIRDTSSGTPVFVGRVVNPMA
jgi:serpin B